MGTLRRLVRGVLARVGARVAQDELFEKPGERAPTMPLDGEAVHRPVAPPAASSPSPGASAAGRPAVAASPAAAPPKKSPSVASPAEPTVATAAHSPTRTPGPAAPKVAASRPVEGCVPVDEPGLRAALTPGTRPLVINHWATWCDSCTDELPRLVRAAAGVGDTAEFIGVSWDLFDHPAPVAAVTDKVTRVADSAGIGYASVLFTGPAETLYRVAEIDWHFIPQTLVVAPDGRVIWHKRGDIADEDVAALVRAVAEAAS